MDFNVYKQIERAKNINSWYIIFLVFFLLFSLNVVLIIIFTNKKSYHLFVTLLESDQF